MTPDPRWSTADQSVIALGRELAEAVPPDERPTWAADVLAACEARYGGITPVQDVLAIARDRARWPLAHAAFSACRAVLLAEERASPGRRKQRKILLLYVAEIVAKVTYNASGQPAPFDADSSWWLARCARAFVEHVGDPAFELAVWHQLARIRPRAGGSTP